MTSLGVFGGDLSQAYAINDLGQVVGLSTTSNRSNGYNYDHHAFLWETGVMVDLGTLGGNFSDALDINNNGQVVGNSTLKIRGSETHDFLYENGKMYDLNDLIDNSLGWTINSASAINEVGQIACWSAPGNGFCTPILLSPVTPTEIHIRANGQDDSVIVTPADVVSIEISLGPGDKTDQNADWWLIEATPSGDINHFDLSTGSMVSGLLPTYQGPLFGFSSIPLLNSDDLSAGTHVLCFAVDLNMDSSLNTDSLYYDCVTVMVTGQ